MAKTEINDNDFTRLASRVLQTEGSLQVPVLEQLHSTPLQAKLLQVAKEAEVVSENKLTVATVCPNMHKKCVSNCI